MAPAEKIRVLRVEWRTHGPVEGTLYWPDDAGEHRPPWHTELYRRFRLSTTYVDHFSIGDRWLQVTATPAEAEQWRQAAIAFFERVRQATGPLLRQRTTRHRLRWVAWAPGLRGGFARRKEAAQEAYLAQVRAALAVVRAAQAEIERRLTADEAARESETQRRLAEQNARDQAALAEVEAWQRRRETFEEAASWPRWSRQVEDGVLHVSAAPQRGLTARQLAQDAVGVSRVEWEASARTEVEAAVGDFAAWWERQLRVARNTAARDAAIATLVGAAETAAATLEAAGRPGITESQHDINRRVRHGWSLAFGTARIGVPLPRLQPPPTPNAYATWQLSGAFGELGEHTPQLALGVGDLLTAGSGGPDAYRISTFSPSGTHHYTRHQRTWRDRTFREYADWVFHDQALFLQRQSFSIVQRCAVTEHTDPAEYGPYVAAVADLGATGFLALIDRYC